MYHDQGHIPSKLLDFEGGVNVALGLPIIRTSVDHGTAFDIAWKGVASNTANAPPLRVRFRGHDDRGWAHPRRDLQRPSVPPAASRRPRRCSVTSRRWVWARTSARSPPWRAPDTRVRRAQPRRGVSSRRSRARAGPRRPPPPPRRAARPRRTRRSAPRRRAGPRGGRRGRRRRSRRRRRSPPGCRDARARPGGCRARAWSARRRPNWSTHSTSSRASRRSR